MDSSEVLIREFENFCLDSIIIHVAKLDSLPKMEIFEREYRLDAFTTILRILRINFADKRSKIMITAQFLPMDELGILRFHLSSLNQTYLQCFIVNSGYHDS